MPAADVITPNQFELDLLTGRTSATLADACAAIDALHALGPRVVLVTSLHHGGYAGRCAGYGGVRGRQALSRAHAKTADLGQRRGRCDRGAVLRPLAALRLRRDRACRTRPRRSSDCSDADIARKSGRAQEIRCCVSTAQERDSSQANRARSVLTVREDMHYESNAPPLRHPRCLHGAPLCRQSARGRARRQRLDTDAMQTIAREFNLPETVFLLPPEDRRTGRGCASSRRRRSCRSPAIRRSAPPCCSGSRHARRFVLKEEIGEVPCRVEARGADHGYAEFDLPRLPKRISDAAEAEAIAAFARPHARRSRLRGFRARHLVGRQRLHARAGARARRDGARDARDGALGRRLGRRQAGIAIPVLPRNGESRPRVPRAHVRARDGYSGRPRDRLGARAAFAGLIAESGGLATTARTSSRSSRATRWAARA